jgi:hypothetical protein
MSFLRSLLFGSRQADSGRVGYYIEGDGDLVRRSSPNGPLVPVGGGGISLVRSGVLNIVDSSYPGASPLFASKLNAGAILLRAWAVFDFANLNFTGTVFGFQIWLAQAASDADGQLVASYDLSVEFPTAYGSPPWMAEANPLDTLSSDVFANAQRSFIVPAGQAGALYAYSQGDGAGTDGTYEVFALVA